MALPKLNYPTYTTTIPSTNVVAKFRPFTVNEEKLLLTAADSKDLSEMTEATRTIIGNCFNLESTDDLTSYDIDYLFIQLRIKSVSPTSELFFRNQECVKNGGNPCEKSVKVTINLEDVKVMEYDEESEKYVDYTPKNKVAGGFKVELTDEVGIIMKHPGFIEKEKYTKIENPDDADLIKLCIVSVYDADAVYTRDDFTETELDDFYEQLTTDNRNKLSEFVQNIPQIRYETSFTCKECGFKEDLLFNDLDSFFS